MDQKPGLQDQADRSRRWREGVKQRLDQIQAELREIGAGIEQQLAALTDRFGENERQQAAAVKPRSDDERRTWLRLSKLTGERDKAEDERNQLRRQLLGAIASGPDWPGPPMQELRERLQAATATWNALIEEIRAIHDADRPPSVISKPPPIIGGILQTHVPVMRTRR
jgi:hypothetical protein